MKMKLSLVLLLGLLGMAFASCKKEQKPTVVAPASTNIGPNSMPEP